ncbi:MAG: alkaline phosphatase family protein, partial [Acidobacteriaceae bacterium]|nr:alkaline phosphatase family protein [Acidobacteriaceae bacterium]
MNRIVWTLPFWFLFCSTLTHGQPLNPPAHRVVILKVDGLNADLLYGAMRQRDPSTGKPCLPWLSHIFVDQGVIYENFYTRGISLSAPSWSMLDTGQHTIIHGNVEYDRYTGHIYDYLNFFPFYLRNAWAKEVDMPGVEVLDRAGIPLLIDHFRYQQVYQSFQLFQRGVRWATLTSVLKRKFSSKSMLSLIEGGGPSLGELWAQQTEKEIDAALQDRDTEYLDFFTGDLDHTGHATNNPAAMLAAMEQLDVLAGRLWTAIQASPLADKTVFIIVSDHGMNNDPGVVSQGFSLPDVFNSPEGGAHHVMTNRHPLTDYKLRGLDPLVERAFSPSEASFYLKDQGWHYLTAWLDLDGNERASVQLRNSDLNKIHILLLQLSLNGLSGPIRRAATAALNETIDRHRQAWTDIADQLAQELSELQRSIEERKILVHQLPKKWTREQHALGEHRKAKRLNRELA